MLNNDVLRSLRYTLKASDAQMAEIAALGGCTVDEAEVRAWLSREDEDGYQECPDEAMARFLDGLIYFKRGKDRAARRRRWSCR